MSVPVEFHFDFGSPNAYLSHLVIPDIATRTGIDIQYVPVLLGGVFKLTGNMSPAQSMAGIKNKPEYQALETARFVQRYGITRYERNPHFPVNTLQIMRGATFARLHELDEPGYYRRYLNAVFEHMWGTPKKMDELDVIQAALNESGFDAASVLAGASQPEVKQALLEATGASVERGNFGSPTFFVGSEMFFGKDNLRDFEECMVAMAGKQ
jgi:2-hydroxychromene-2-carboxylate isomerase